ncbi:glycoside hydrolase superfamily [Trichophaea hybrida]|nr:glycoside hydrolase superfamily [Trichophaea hybrida]
MSIFSFVIQTNHCCCESLSWRPHPTPMIVDMVLVLKGTAPLCYASVSISQRRRRWQQPRWDLARNLLIALCFLVYHIIASGAAQTTFRNCTYDGVLDNFPTPLTFNDITGTIGSVSWGVSIDNSILTVDDYIASLGGDHSPAIINIYFDTSHLGGANDPLNCQVAAVKAAGAILMITVEPWQGLHTIDSTKTAELSQLCRDINDAGVPLFVRFAHEMNGDWYPWGARPNEYKNAFRAIGAAIKAVAGNTLLVWAPNTGVGYPYNGAGSYLPANTEDRFKQMDTNGDGVLDNLDDPFTPYYPGDDMVDWIGISVYSKVRIYSSFYFFGLFEPNDLKRDNGKPDKNANKLSDRLSLKTFINNPNAKSNFNLYVKFAQEKKKPFMIAETAAAYYPDFDSGDGEVAIKEDWWEQFWSDDTMKTFPLLKAVVWFEYLKTANTGEVRDYTIIKNSQVRDAFSSDIRKTDAVAFLDSSKRKLTGGNGGCACTRPGDANGNGKDDKDAANTTSVDKMVVVLGLGMMMASFWVALGT